MHRKPCTSADGLGCPRERSAARPVKAKSSASVHAVSASGGAHVASRPAPMRTSRSFSTARSHYRAAATSVSRARTLRSSRLQAARVRNTRTAITTRSRDASRLERSLARANTLRTNRVESARLRGAQPANANANIRVAARNNVAINRARNARIVNNWQSDRFRAQSYAAFRDYRRQWHNRTWWRNHYSRIIFVSGGWWYWNAGYWYPAWGYDSYAYYPYDGPIYAYNGLAPDQVIVDVQSQLQRDGYYDGPIDGILGPMTQEAIAAF